MKIKLSRDVITGLIILLKKEGTRDKFEASVAWGRF